MIDAPESPLPIIRFDNRHTWADLLDLCKDFLTPGGEQRLERCLKECTKSIAIERHYIDKDYRDTFSNYHSKRFTTPLARCLRLHFFDTGISRKTLRDPKYLNRHYCGYSIIRPTRPFCLGRTLLNPTRIGYPHGGMCLCEESLSLQGIPLSVSGFPFISQDADVTVCAQSALWMVIRYFSNRYPMYREMYPYQITQLTRDYSIGRLVPSTGLTDWQMAEALRQVGLSPLIYERSSYPTHFEHIMYTYVESGIPILASTNDHVIACFGHYSRYDKPIKRNRMQSEVLRSSFFNEGFIVSDDNAIPYERLNIGRGGSASGAYSSIPFKKIEAFTAPLPPRVFLPAEQFETVASGLLKSSEFGIESCSPSLRVKPLVTRTFLTTGRSFKRHLDIRGMGNNLVFQVYCNMPLPHFIWICEFSTLDLYRKHEILGELVWDATRNVYEPSGWLALHYPERLFIDTGSAFNFNRSVIKFDLDKNTHYPLMRHNLQGI
jgi:hypothetical protein